MLSTPILVPDLEGMTVAEATTALNDEGLVMGTQQTVFHSTIAEDLVTESQPPEGTEVEGGSTVNVRVSRGNVVYVDKDLANKGGSDGLSWETAFIKIQDGIDLADSFGGGQVWVAEGTYNEQRTGSTTGALELGDNVELYGGFDVAISKGADTFNDRDWNANPTTIDGANGRGPGLKAYHVVEAAEDSRIDGFIITGGLAVGPTHSDTYGGGVYIPEVDTVIANCTVTGNTATTGGGIYSKRCETTILDTFITNNTATGDGGGLYCLTFVELVMTNCNISQNNATSNGGGLVTTATTDSVLTNCVFFLNTAVTNGGAIYNYQPSTLDATNCTITKNTATVGGGLYTASTATANFTNAIVWGNTGTTSNDNLYDAGGLITANYSCFASTIIGTGNLNADPEFVDATSGDLTLDHTVPSPCIDAGTDISGTYPNVPSDDYSGNPRPSGLAHDMGAFEYVAL